MHMNCVVYGFSENKIKSECLECQVTCVSVAQLQYFQRNLNVRWFKANTRKHRSCVTVTSESSNMHALSRYVWIPLVLRVKDIRLLPYTQGQYPTGKKTSTTLKFLLFAERPNTRRCRRTNAKTSWHAVCAVAYMLTICLASFFGWPNYFDTVKGSNRLSI